MTRRLFASSLALCLPAFACIAIVVGRCSPASAAGVTYIVRGSDGLISLVNPVGVTLDPTDSTLYVVDRSLPPRILSANLTAGPPYMLTNRPIAPNPLVTPGQLAFDYAYDAGLNFTPVLQVADRDGGTIGTRSALFTYFFSTLTMQPLGNIVRNQRDPFTPYEEINGVARDRTDVTFADVFFCDLAFPTNSGSLYRFRWTSQTPPAGTVDILHAGSPLVNPYAVATNSTGTILYIADYGAPAQGTPGAVFRMDIALGAQPTPIVPRGPFQEIAGIDEYNSTVFFSAAETYLGRRNIYSVPADGGTPMPLAAFIDPTETATPHHPEQIVVGRNNPTRIYAVDSVPAHMIGVVTPAIYYVESEVTVTPTVTATPPTPTPTRTFTNTPAVTATRNPEPEGDADLLFGDTYIGEIDDFDDRDRLLLHGIAGMRVSILVAPTYPIIEDQYPFIFNLQPVCELRDPDGIRLFDYGDAITWNRFRVRNYVLQKSGIYILTIAGRGRGSGAMGGYVVMLRGRAPNFRGAIDGTFAAPGEQFDLFMPAIAGGLFGASYISRGALGSIQVFAPSGELMSDANQPLFADFETEETGIHIIQATAQSAGDFRISWNVSNPRGGRFLEE